MPRIPKSSSCDKGRCQKHLFILKPTAKALYFPKPQRAKFCPKFHKDSKQFQNSIPATNTDQKEYTPLFILQQEKIYYVQNNQKLKASHKRKVEECTQKSQLYVPRHARTRQYCSVCKALYEEYLDHIEGEDHKINLRKNKYNQYISDLQKLVSPKIDLNKSIQNPVIATDQFSSQFEKILSEQLKTGDMNHREDLNIK